MRIEAFARAHTDHGCNLLVQAARVVRAATSRQEEVRRFGPTQARPVRFEKLLQQGRPIRTVGTQIDMVRIHLLLACANLEVIALEVEMSVFRALVLVQMFAQLDLPHVALAEWYADQQLQDEAFLKLAGPVRPRVPGAPADVKRQTSLAETGVR